MTMPLGLPRLRTLFIILFAYAVVGLLAYGNALDNEFVTWDDTGLITENENITAINATTLKNVFSTYDPELYIPLTFVSYQIDHAIGGLNPTIFHATNLLLHILNAALVAALLYVLLGSGALCIGLGLLFLLHPLNTEAVAWASSRKDVLSAFFFLSSVLAYLMSRSGSPRVPALALSVVLFGLGLLSKVMVISLPVVLLLLDWLEGRSPDKRMFIEKVPYVLLAVVFGIVALFGKASVLASVTPWQTVLMAGKSTFFYVWKFLFPVRLSFAYPFNGVIRFSSPEFFIPIIFVILFAVVIWRIRHRHKDVVFGVALYAITLLPTFSNFSKGGDVYVASDRYAYLPMIGLLLLLGIGIHAWLQRATTVRAQSSQRNTLRIFSFSILLAMLFLAAKQADVWQNSKSLYAHALVHYPQARAAHHNLGMEYLRVGDAATAIEKFDAASAIKEDIRTRTNRAAALVMLGRLQDARNEYEAAMKMNADDPDAYYGIANIEYKSKKYDAAIRMYRRALDVKPDYTNALNNLGGLYLELGRWDDAIAVLRQSLSYYPDFPASHYNLGGAYEAKGLLLEAEQEYAEAMRLNPGDADAIARLATLHYDRKAIDSAAGLLRKALQRDSSNPVALTLLQRMKQDGVAE